MIQQDPPHTMDALMNAMQNLNQETSLSHRGSELYAFGAAVDDFKAIIGNIYDPDTNPDGIVNLGTAENVSHGRE